MICYKIGKDNTIYYTATIENEHYKYSLIIGERRNVKSIIEILKMSQTLVPDSGKA